MPPPLGVEFKNTWLRQRSEEQRAQVEAETTTPAEPGLGERMGTRAAEFFGKIGAPGLLSSLLPFVPAEQAEAAKTLFGAGDIAFNILNLIGESVGEGAERLLRLIPTGHLSPEDTAMWEKDIADIKGVFTLAGGGVPITKAPVAAKTVAQTALRTVEHYSTKLGQARIVEPAKFGTGVGGRQARRAVEPGFVPETYLYTAGTTPESPFAGMPKFRGEIPESQIYDLTADPLGLKQTGKPTNQIIQDIRAKGFTAYERTGADSPVPGAVVSLEPVTVRFALADDILKTHLETGGSTYNLRTGTNLAGQPKWAVGVHPERTVALEHPPTPADIDDFIRKNMDLLEENPTLNVGTWVETTDDGQKTGRHVFDLSVAADSRDEAMSVAKKHKQKGFTNLQTLETEFVAKPVPGFDMPAPPPPPAKPFNPPRIKNGPAS